MLDYYAPIRLDNCTISIDKLKIVFLAQEEFINEIEKNPYCFANMFLGFSFDQKDTRSYQYRYKYIKTYDNKATMTVMIKHNSNEPFKCMLSLNPNKAFNNKMCINDIKHILKISMMYWIAQLDIAVDIQIDNNNITLLKDQRVEIEYRKNKTDCTQYLGKKRNKVGHVKKYDKAKECNLNIPLTRIEITCGNPAKENFATVLKRNLPKTYIYQEDILFNTESNNNCEYDNLNDTEKVLVRLLTKTSEKFKYWNKLGRKMKTKLKPYVFANAEEMLYDEDKMIEAANQIIDLLNFDFADLANGIYYNKGV